MRLKPEQLSAHLDEKLAPVYVLHGDESLLVTEAADLIRKAAVRHGCTEREIHHVEGHFRWDRILESGQSMSLFSQAKLIDIRIPSGKPGTEGSRILQAWASQPPSDTITLILLPKLDKASQNSKWFTALDQAGVSIAISAISLTALPRWIAERMARNQQSTTPQALTLISEKVEGNLLAAQQEISKLALLHPAGRLTLEQVREAVLDVARFDAFQLADALLAGQAQRMLRILGGLRNEGEAPTLILWVMAREIRLMIQLASAAPSAQKMRELGIWDSRQDFYASALRRLRRPVLEAALHQTAAIDRMIKGLDSRDPWLELEQLALSLCR